MGLSGTIDSSVYEGLQDVLQRQPAVTAVTYQPDSIVKRFLRAQVDAERVVPPTGPASPTIDVEWRFTGDEQQYRIHYADPNAGFNCGWHRDDDAVGGHRLPEGEPEARSRTRRGEDVGRAHPAADVSVVEGSEELDR